MAKIRWTKGQQDRLRKAVDAFRKKVERYSDSDIAEALPEVPKVRQLKKQITTAKELNDLVKDLRAFSTGANKGKPQIYVNPQGVKMTEWERQRVNKAIDIVNKQKQERVQKLESQNVYDAEGNLLPDLKRVAKKFEERAIKKRPEKFRTTAEWRKFAETMQEQMYDNYDDRRLNTLKNNMVTALKGFWGKDGKIYANIISRMSIDQMREAYNKNPEVFSPEFIYTRDVYDSTAKSREETARDRLEEVIYNFADREMSRSIIDDELAKLKKSKAAAELKRSINDLDDMQLEYNLKAYYDVLNKSVTAEKKLEMLRAQKLI